MNRKTIQKVIDELNKPQPKLDYIRGILETIIEGLPEEINSAVAVAVLSRNCPPSLNIPISDTSDEGSMLDAEARAKLARVQELSNESNV